MKRSATAVWRGTLKAGRGTLSTESRALSHVPYSFATRFQEQKGANPEELIAAAEAACFSMAFAAELERLRVIPDSIETKASVSLEETSNGWGITGVQLVVSAQAGTNEEQFSKALEAAKKNCPVSKLLKAPITVEKKLSNSVVTPMQETD